MSNCLGLFHVLMLENCDHDSLEFLANGYMISLLLPNTNNFK